MLTMVQTRKALGTLLREAAERQGLTLECNVLPDFGGRLMYRITGPRDVDGTSWLTPGEMANRLGVKW